tara:strand:- start:6 stop:533 length:528 start_codon:yes stop_codon:yes gene_type:complete
MLRSEHYGSLKFLLASENKTSLFAKFLATISKPGDIYALRGTLGSGKTTVARYFIHSLIEKMEEIPSPTFTMVQIYDALLCPIYHFDMYRLNQPSDSIELGIDEAFAEGISLIEWPEHLGPFLPNNRLDICMYLGRTEISRKIEIIAQNQDWTDRLKQLSFQLNKLGITLNPSDI